MKSKATMTMMSEGNMDAIYIISGVAIVIGLITLYAEDIQRWTEKTLRELDKKYPCLKKQDGISEVGEIENYRTKIQHLSGENGFIALSDEMLKALGWSEGTELKLTRLDDGSITLSKANV